jgi:hypothetical protein
MNWYYIFFIPSFFIVFICGIGICIRNDIDSIIKNEKVILFTCLLIQILFILAIYTNYIIPFGYSIYNKYYNYNKSSGYAGESAEGGTIVLDVQYGKIYIQDLNNNIGYGYNAMNTTITASESGTFGNNINLGSTNVIVNSPNSEINN